MDQIKYQEYKDKLQDFNNKIKENPQFIEEIAEDYNSAISYVNDFEEISRLKDQYNDNQNIKDSDLYQIIKEENTTILKKIKEIEKKYIQFDKDDFKNVILEIRAGTGGDEAALFCEEIFEVYKKYVISKGWNLDLLDISVGSNGGFKQAIIEIKGNMAYSNLKVESGVHRVQRVPKTESSGRIHTSTISVVVLPEIKDKDFQIKDSDLRFDYFRASGAGGQHVNKTDSAVRITYLPTGMIVTSQNTRSQLQNKEAALQILRSRLYNIQKEETLQKESKKRQQQISGSKRAEKIRTYNFLQDRITDHRLGKSKNYHINDIFEKNQLQDLIDDIKNESN
jgi:peptide chain release factor 1